MCLASVVARLTDACSTSDWQNCLFVLCNQVLLRFFGTVIVCDVKRSDSNLLERKLDSESRKTQLTVHEPPNAFFSSVGDSHKNGLLWTVLGCGHCSGRRGVMEVMGDELMAMRILAAVSRSVAGVQEC